MRQFNHAGQSAVPERLRSEIFRGADAVAEGLISATRLRREYRRVLHGIYVPFGVRVDHGVRTLAALLCLPPGTVLTAHSSAWWYGLEYAETSAPVMAILPAGDHRGGPRGVKVFRGHLDSADVTLVDGIRVTSPVRTAWDAATLTDSASALAITDGLLRRNLMTPGQLRLVAEERSGTWGVCRARKVFDLADGLSESPAESWTRWLLHESCIPPAVLQFEVLDERQHLLARVDFGWPDQKVALEYDGAYHDEPLQQVKDQRRDEALTKMGWTVIHMTASDLRDPSRVLHALRQALVR